MRKIGNKLSFLFLVVSMLAGVCVKDAGAFLLPPGPGTPTVDPLADVNMTIDYGVQVVNNTTSGITKLKQEQTKLVKAAKEKLAGEVEGLMPSKKDKNKKEKAVPGSKKIAECKIADIEKPSSVKKAFYKLFLAYPSDKSDEMTAYRDKASEFYQDTIVEAYVASRELEKELDELEKNFAKLTPMLVTGEGGNGAESGDDNNGTWKNAYTAYDTMNQLLKITEELAAMRAQLEAAKAVKHHIVPAAYKKKSKESSLLEKRGNLQLASRSVRYGSEKLVFAQVDFNNFQKASVSSTPAVSSNGGASITSFAQQRKAAAVQASRQEAIGIISGQSAASSLSKSTANDTAVEDEDYEYDPATDSSVKYMRAPEPDIASPFKGNEEKMDELDKLDPLYEKATEALELHNLLQSLPTHKENAEKYNRHRQLHDKSVEMLRTADKCALQFLGRYYDDPEKVWAGGPISDENTANYDLRSGISGWAIKAFEIAKAETTAPVDSDDGIVAEIDLIDTGDMTKRSENENAYKEKAQGLGSPDEEEKVEAINRETELIAWKIGAEAAKKLAEDQYSSNPQWGTAQTRFPVWNDQKNFYNQYIDGKYNNIKEYLAALQFNQVSLNIAQELNNILTEDPEVKAYNARELGRLAGIVGDDDETEEEEAANDEITSLVAQKQADLEKAADKRRNALKPLEEQKENINKSIEEASAALSSFNERINQLKKEKLTAQSSVEDMQVQLEIADDVAEYARENGEENEEDSVSQAFAKESIKENQARETSVEPEIERYQGLAKVQEEKIEQLKNRLEQVEKQIAAVEESYTRQVQELEEKYTAAFEAARKKIQDGKTAKAAKTLLSLYRENVERTVVGDLIGTASVRGIISQAEGLVVDTKSYAVQAVETARSDIYKLGDELYLPGSSAMVVKRHAELMKELQNIPVDKLVASSSSLGKFGSNTVITSALTTLFQKVVTQRACADGRCENADEEYFIGLEPKDKDFSAPKAAPEMNMAPVREIVRFDTVSYDNVPKTADGTVSRQGFLNYGEEIPTIWQKMLQENIFVEREVDLAAILEAGSGREGAFMRGGRYPCKLGEKIIDIDPYDGQYMVVSELAGADGAVSRSSGGSNNSAANMATREFLKKIGVYIEDKISKTGNPGVSIDENKLPQCQEIEIIGNSGLAAKFYYTVRDIEADTEGPAAIQPKETIGSPSELGTLLKAQDAGGIRFADKPLEVFERLKKIAEEQDNPNSEYQTNLKDEIFNNAPYNINQIGDFLDYVEVETTYRQTLEELKASLDEVNDMLKEQLVEAGFTPTSDFDISKDEDYELARSSLDRLKNKLVEEGFSGISGVNVSDNEVVEERLNKIKRIFTALRKDKDELLPLNENSPSDSELDEQIKTEEVNKSVVGEYDKKVEEEFQKQLNNFKPPFCAAY